MENFKKVKSTTKKMKKSSWKKIQKNEIINNKKLRKKSTRNQRWNKKCLILFNFSFQCNNSPWSYNCLQVINFTLFIQQTPIKAYLYIGTYNIFLSPSFHWFRSKLYVLRSLLSNNAKISLIIIKNSSRFKAKHKRIFSK